MPATLTTVDAILKEIYEGSLRDQLFNKAIGLKRIERTSEGVTNEVGGRWVVFPIRTRRNNGIGARREMEPLPTPGQQGYAGARVSLKYLYGGVRLSGPTIELADSNPQAFVSALDQEVSGLKSDLIKDQNRQFYGDGSGTLAVATAVSASGNTFTSLSTNGPSIKYVELGQVVDVILGTSLGNANPTVVASARNVTGLVASTGVVTLDGAVFAVAVGDVLVRTGSVNREPTGLAAIINTGNTLYNINPATEPVWQSTVDSNAGTARPLSEGLMIKAVDTAYQQAGEVSAGFCDLGVRRSYFNLLVQQRRYTNTTEFAGGFKGLAFTTDNGDIPIVTDPDAPNGALWFVDEGQVKVYRDKEWEWMNRDGSNWQRVIGYDAYEATYYLYGEIGTHKRNAHSAVKDITES